MIFTDDAGREYRFTSRGLNIWRDKFDYWLLLCGFIIREKQRTVFIMHYTGTVWRPPYEAARTLSKNGLGVLLLEKCRLPRYKSCSGILIEKSMLFIEQQFGCSDITVYRYFDYFFGFPYGSNAASVFDFGAAFPCKRQKPVIELLT